MSYASCDFILLSGIRAHEKNILSRCFKNLNRIQDLNLVRKMVLERTAGQLRFDSALDAADAFGRLKGCGDKCVSS